MKELAEELHCPICLDVLDAACETNCGHCFCAQCLATHLHHHNSCPLCRRVIENANPSFGLRRLVNRARGQNVNRSDAAADAALKRSLAAARFMPSQQSYHPPRRPASNQSIINYIAAFFVVALVGYWVLFMTRYSQKRALAKLQQDTRPANNKADSATSNATPTPASATQNPPVTKPLKMREEEEDESRLLRAARIGDTQGVEEALKKKPKSLMKERAKGGLTALHLAAANGHKDTVMQLLRYGADLEAISDNLHRPLHVSAERGHVAVAEILLASGAKVNEQTAHGHTPLFLAAAAGFGDMAELLLSYHADWQSTDLRGDAPLHAAATGGFSLVVKTLLKHGADGSQPGWMNWSPLYIAARAGHVEVARLLLNDGRGASTLEKFSKENATPLYVACEYGRTAVVSLLLSRGANLEVPMISGATALVIAAQKGHREIVRVLLQHGAITSVAGAQGMNALHLAAIGGHSEIVALLAEAGADLDLLDAREATALHYAVIKKLASSVTLLLRYGANPLLQDVDGLTPLSLAASSVLSHLFDGVHRVQARVTPIATELLMPTTVTINSITSLVELCTIIERLYEGFRVVSLTIDTGDKFFFDQQQQAQAAMEWTADKLAGENQMFSVSVAALEVDERTCKKEMQRI